MIGASTIAGELRIDYPKSLDPGKDIEIKVDGNLVDLSKHWYDFWAGYFTAERAGYRDGRIFGGNGTVIGPDYLPGFPPTLRLGSMPSTSVNIIVKMWANEDYWSSFDWDNPEGAGWEEIVSRTITIKSKAEAVEVPWGWIALGGGAIVAALVVSQMARREK